MAFLGNLSVIMISTTLYIYIDQVFNEVPAFLSDWHYIIAVLPIVFWASVLLILGEVNDGRRQRASAPLEKFKHPE